MQVTAGGAEGGLGFSLRNQGYLSVYLGQVKDRDEAGAPQLLHQAVHSGKGVAVEMRHLVQLTEVSAEPDTAIGLWHHNDWAGPGAGTLLDDAITEHPADVLLNSLTVSLRDLVGLLSYH